MKSKITIGIDYDNQPVVKIEHCHSEDVRDVLVKRFIEGFGYESSWALFRCDETGGSNTACTIRPISSERLNEMIIEANSALRRISNTGDYVFFTKGEVILKGGDHYKCICADNETAVFAKITKWSESECRVDYESTLVYQQGEQKNPNFSIVSELVSIDYDSDEFFEWNKK